MIEPGIEGGESSEAIVSNAQRNSILLVLRHRDFRLLWLGQAVSVLGTQMQHVAINWHVWVIAKSPLALGGVGLARAIPILSCSLLGGLVADSFDRKRLMLVTQSIMLACAATLALTTLLHFERLWLLYLLTSATALALAFDNPARQALMPRLVPVAELPRALSLGMIAFQCAMVVGPTLAGIVLGIAGPGAVYAFNAISFVAVIGALKLMRGDFAPDTATAAAGFGLGAIVDGLRFVVRTPIIVQTMLLDFVATFFASANTLLPIFASEILRVGPYGLGLLASAPAVGSIVVAFVMARVQVIRRQGNAIVLAILIYGIATVGFGFSRFIWLSMLMLAITGAADTVSTVLRQTLRQLETPDRLRGRMTSVNMIFFMGGPQLGELEAGTVAALIGAQLAVATGGIGCILAALIALAAARSLRSYEGRTS